MRVTVIGMGYVGLVTGACLPSGESDTRYENDPDEFSSCCATCFGTCLICL